MPDLQTRQEGEVAEQMQQSQHQPVHQYPGVQIQPVGQPGVGGMAAQWRPGMALPAGQGVSSGGTGAGAGIGVGVGVTRQPQIHLHPTNPQPQLHQGGGPVRMSMPMPMPMPVPSQQQSLQHPPAAAMQQGGGIPYGQPVPPQYTAVAKRPVDTRELSQALSSAEVLRQHKRKKPTDRSLPSLAYDEQLESLKKEYEKLVELEKTLDATCTRKKAEMLDESSSMKKTTWKSLRVRISNECSNQEWQEASNEAGSSTSKPNFDTGKGIPNWTVKIEGKLVDIGNVTPAPEAENEYLPKFSQMVQHLSIDIKRPEGTQHREPALLNWQPSQNTPPSDGFSFTRSGTAASEIQISLYPSQHPRRYKVAPELSNLLDVREESKLGILNAMWTYIQRERLLENSSNAPDADRRNIKLDDQLSKLFGGVQKLSFFQISENINRYLSSPDPVSLSYTVDVGPTCAESAKVFDILIEMPDPSLRTSQSILRSLAPAAPTSQEIIKIDDQIAALAANIRTTVYQHSLLDKFSKNPVNFMNEWMDSQSLDLQDLLDPDPAKYKGTDGEWKIERLRDSQWFQQDWVKQAVGLHVARAQAASK